MKFLPGTPREHPHGRMLYACSMAILECAENGGKAGVVRGIPGKCRNTEIGSVEPYNRLIVKEKQMVPRGGIEPPTLRFSVAMITEEYHRLSMRMFYAMFYGECGLRFAGRSA